MRDATCTVCRHRLVWALGRWWHGAPIGSTGTEEEAAALDYDHDPEAAA